MGRQQPIELFMPPNMLKAKAGGGLGGVDMAALKRAEAAMETLQGEFADMAADDVKNLVAARARYAATPDAAARSGLLRAAFDIKGNAPTFDFPLIGRVAASLAKLIGESPQNTPLPAALVDAHVNAIQVIHKQNIHATDDRMAQTLCAELDAKVEEMLATRK
jgi:HPt (histidine-containing phosphotransfer) domain-containing protein